MCWLAFVCKFLIYLLQDCTIRSCDFDTEQTWVLHSPEKKMERITIDTEVYLALTPLQPVVFFGFHRRMSVTGSFFDTFFFLFLIFVCCHLFIWFCTSKSYLFPPQSKREKGNMKENHYYVSFVCIISPKMLLYLAENDKHHQHLRFFYF